MISESKKAANLRNVPLAQKVKEAVDDINGHLPLAEAYRRMVYYRKIRRFWDHHAREDYEVQQYEFIATLVRIMWHNQPSGGANAGNLFFFSKFLSELGLFRMVPIAWCEEIPAWSQRGNSMGGRIVRKILAPDVLLHIQIYSQRAIEQVEREFEFGLPELPDGNYLSLRRTSPMVLAQEKSKILSGLAGLLERGGFEIASQVKELLALTAYLRSKGRVVLFEPDTRESPPLTLQQIRRVQKITEVCISGLSSHGP